MINERFKQQVAFILEIDKIKAIIRKTKLFDGTRCENDAEHAWHLAMMAMVLAEHANEPIDVTKVVKMVLIHDIVEIDAGDVMIYDTAGREAAKEKEEKAAERIYGLLPEDLRDEMIEIWHEFEERQTPEAKFASALDRFEPLLQNYMTDFHSWREHDVTHEIILDKNKHIKEGSEAIWDFVETIISEGIAKGAVKKA